MGTSQPTIEEFEMKAKAVKSYEFKQVKQWLSGYHMGYERNDVWRVQIEIGTKLFTSSKTYSSEENAKRAAKRMAKEQDNQQTL